MRKRGKTGIATSARKTFRATSTGACCGWEGTECEGEGSDQDQGLCLSSRAPSLPLPGTFMRSFPRCLPTLSHPLFEPPSPHLDALVAPPLGHELSAVWLARGTTSSIVTLTPSS